MDQHITKPNSQEIINSLTENIAVLDFDGTIISVNEAWVHYGIYNGMPETYNWIGENYLAVCEKAMATGDSYAEKCVKGINGLQTGDIEKFSFEYPCHTGDKPRWFMVIATPYKDDLTRARKGIVVSHIDITTRKLAEIKLEEALASIKTLEGLIPICASCNCIRDDEDFWTKLETYLQKHTDATFTHDICPSCLSDMLE